MIKDLCSFAAMLVFVLGGIVFADGMINGHRNIACQDCSTLVR